MEGLDLNCGLCYNRPSFSSNSTLFPPKEILSSCAEYLSSDILQTLRVMSGMSGFCEECHGSINQLTLFVAELNRIQYNIAQLAAKINKDIMTQRNIHKNKKVRPTKIFPAASQNLPESSNSNMPTLEMTATNRSAYLPADKFSRSGSEKIDNTNNFDDQLDEPHSQAKSGESLENGEEDDTTIRSADILTHMKKAESGYRCENCTRTFSRLTILKSHDCTKETYDCGICGFSFSGPGVLKLHLSRTHSGDQPFKCDTCGKAFGFKHHLARHIRIHTGEKPFECSECGRKFGDQSELAKHKPKHKNIRFPCEICDKSYADMDTLRSHLKIHSDSTNFKCDICHKTFCRPLALKRHKQKAHSNEKPKLYFCEHCGKSFITDAGLNNHLLSHTSEDKLECDICSKLFFCEQYLKQHKKSAHPKLETIICDVCGRTSTSKQRHKNHMKCHNTDYATECEICGKKYKTAANLAYHVRIIHKEDKPHKCDLCEESFKFRLVLRRHKLKKHATLIDKSKFFTCEVCKKIFESNIRLVNHQLLLHHVTSAAFVQCQSCNQKFATLGMYELHNVKRPHMTSNVRCKACCDENNILTFTNYCEFFTHLKDIHNHDLEAYRYKCKRCGFIKHICQIKTHKFKCDCDQQRNNPNPVSEDKLTLSVKQKGRKRKGTSKTSKPVIEKRKAYDLRKIKPGRKSINNKYCESYAESEEDEYSSDQQEENGFFSEGEDEDCEIKEEIESSCESDEITNVDVKVKIEVTDENFH